MQISIVLVIIVQLLACVFLIVVLSCVSLGQMKKINESGLQEGGCEMLHMLSIPWHIFAGLPP